MTRTNLKSVSIAPGLNRPILSKGQKAFNALIKQLEKRRARLGAWEAVTPAFQQKYNSTLLPLEQTYTDLQIRMVHCLDQVHGQKGLTKSERHKIARLIPELAGDLVGERDDTELKAIYNRYSQFDYDSEAAAELEDMKSALEAMLGVELGDNLDMSSPEEVLQRAHAQVQQRQAKEDADHRAREERRTERKKSPRQIAAEARAHAEQAQISLSIREIYRKLASALHPDRETDPLERDRKTALMQRVNQAYSKNNLLQLLELQLELEHIDQSAINSISEDRLRHYNKILKGQLRELDHEIGHVETGFRLSYGIPPFVELSPSTIMRNLASEIVGLQQSVRDLEEDLLVFDDIKKVKAWLKNLRYRPPVPEFEDMPF
ncbi:J domain-containing protein [Cupriavidus sp. CV2]|uniref:J domain-containing protein n=1 Tax=Cupriavidus ulmosensis TaxID=3065913 RepID=UPI00296AE24D|nr:J domain-containing protein [Cupriavidus sp. CV2]MDW3686066.1 J domain-containing protein [Cupriavidus sp. CV2]